MSDRIRADLDYYSYDDAGFDSVLYHRGDRTAPLIRWRKLLRDTAPQGWNEVQKLAVDVMRLIADPRVLFTAAMQLRSAGPKAAGPNKLRLEWLSAAELHQMCTVLAHAIKTESYRTGNELVIKVKKTGPGRRPIILMDIQDRVVQKAAALVLRPMLDTRFDPLSFAFRPWRMREQGIAVAEHLAPTHPVWLPHDLQNAFGRVPVDRLLEVVFKWLPCPRLRTFLSRVLPPRSPSIGGIKQGGSLSPLMLEIYLTHFLHEPWRKTAFLASLLRYADDLLIVAKDKVTAKEIDAYLRGLLTPAGMILKATFDDAVKDIRKRSAEWIGYRCRLVGSDFKIRLASNAYAKLDRRFQLAHAKCRSSERVVQVLQGWIAQLGPCYLWENRAKVCRLARQCAMAQGFEELPSAIELENAWGLAYLRWQRTRKYVRHTPDYLVTGPLGYPTPKSVIW